MRCNVQRQSVSQRHRLWRSNSAVTAAATVTASEKITVARRRQGSGGTVRGLPTPDPLRKPAAPLRVRRSSRTKRSSHHVITSPAMIRSVLRLRVAFPKLLHRENSFLVARFDAWIQECALSQRAQPRRHGNQFIRTEIPGPCFSRPNRSAAATFRFSAARFPSL